LWRPTVALCQLGFFRWKQGQDAASVAMAFCGRNNAPDLYYAHVCADFPTYGAKMGAVAINIKYSNTIVQGCCAGGSIQGDKCRHLRLRGKYLEARHAETDWVECMTCVCTLTSVCMMQDGCGDYK
jgi:hypothetical protein